MSAEGTQSVRGTKLCPIWRNLEIKRQYNDFHGFGLSGPAFGLCGAAKDLQLGPEADVKYLWLVQTALPVGPVAPS